jgi:hypothetical protein
MPIVFSLGHTLPWACRAQSGDDRSGKDVDIARQRQSGILSPINVMPTCTHCNP